VSKLGHSTVPELDPDPDLAVKFPDPAKRSGSDRISNTGVWLAFVLMLTIFHHPKTKTFCLASFLAKNK
jgi:hypothetical protein